MVMPSGPLSKCAKRAVFAVDVTGLAPRATSTFFITRKRDPGEGLPWRCWLKWVVVETKQQLLLTHALYLPDGENVVRSNMTLGQAIEAIAFAYSKAMKPELGDKCNMARIEFKDGKFIVSFADSVDQPGF